MSEQDFLKQLGPLGLIARLKRLSDSMLYGIREVYQSKGYSIEPNWHFVFLYLKQKGSATLSEMSKAFGLSQPALVKIINKMKDRGYLVSALDDSDGRRRILKLSKNAYKDLEEFEKTWLAGSQSIEELLGPSDSLMTCLESFETQLAEKSFAERIRSNSY